MRMSATNNWIKIADKVPGRMDSQIKNFWHYFLKKKQKEVNY